MTPEQIDRAMALANAYANETFFTGNGTSGPQNIRKTRAALHDYLLSVSEPVVTGWNDGLSQDYDKRLGKWFADKPGARQQLVEAFSPPQPVAHKETKWLE